MQGQENSGWAVGTGTLSKQPSCCSRRLVGPVVEPAFLPGSGGSTKVSLWFWRHRAVSGSIPLDAVDAHGPW